MRPHQGRPGAGCDEPRENLWRVSLADALFAASHQYITPVNRNSALFQYARGQNLGDFLSAEFSLQHQGSEYRAQVFERGIVYVRVNQPDIITHITL